MKKFLTTLLGLAAPAAMLATGMAAPAQSTDIVDPDSTGFKFTEIATVKTTPVKDQNKSGTCWSFAGVGMLEDEVLRKTGKEVDLSEMFVVRHCYDDKADKWMRMEGKINFAQGGAAGDVIYVLDNYGIVPEEAYTGLQYGEEKHAHYEMAEGLTGYLQGIAKKKNKKLTPAWKRGYDGILDAYLGEIPETFVVDGRTYTPKEYAKSLGLNADDYISITSFTHHPFYESFPIEVADNWLWLESMNVPMEEMKAIVDNALQNGYSVAWSADVSEGGFKWNNGYALLPAKKNVEDMDNAEVARWSKLTDKERDAQQYEINGPVKEKTVTQQSRQQGFDSQETTDDHGMVLVGIAEDQEGNRYYKVKNSWDTNQVYGGFFYASEPYFLEKTICVMVNKEAIPKDIRKKFKD